MLAAAAWLALLSCSSDPANTLGSDSDLLGSGPGIAYKDTVSVFDDTTYAFNTPIATDTDLEIGTDALYQRSIIVQPGFAELDTFPSDLNRTVESASIHFYTGDLGGNFLVRFYALGKKYVEGDEVTGLDELTDADIIPDDLGGFDRNLEVATANYPIPPALAQEWIRDETTRTGIVVRYIDTGNHHLGTVRASETTSGSAPYLKVNFTDGRERAYDVRNDATVYEPLTTTSNLIVSDGYPRRIFFRARIDSLAKDSAVASAKIRFHIVPGSMVTPDSLAVTKNGVSTEVPIVSTIMYIPDSADPDTTLFKSGQRITPVDVRGDLTTVEFPLANAVFRILQGTLKNTGFAIRCADENTRLRQVEFYGIDAPDSLRPRMFVTSSTPADFH
jgi:hypothetical protein